MNVLEICITFSHILIHLTHDNKTFCIIIIIIFTLELIESWRFDLKSRLSECAALLWPQQGLLLHVTSHMVREWININNVLHCAHVENELLMILSPL